MQAMIQPRDSLQDLLFHELHHRFYNSLQLVSASLSRLASGRQTIAQIRLLQDRVVMLGRLHRMLSEPLLNGAALESILQDLCRTLSHSFDCGEVKLFLDATAFPNDPMIVRCLTLVIVELITNALKHGQSNGSLIHVVLVNCRDCCLLTVVNKIDDGSSCCGNPPYVATRLVKAMGGTLSVRAERHYAVIITVPTVSPK